MHATHSKIITGGRTTVPVSPYEPLAVGGPFVLSSVKGRWLAFTQVIIERFAY